MISGEHRGGLIVVRSKKTSNAGDEKVLDDQTPICYVPVFYEYSDWRNGDMLYLYDLRVTAQSGSESISF